MTRTHRGLALSAVALAASALLLDMRSPAAAWSPAIPNPGDYSSAPALAERIARGDATLHVVDLRGREDFELLHVAGAAHMTLDDLRRDEMPRSGLIVLYADDETRALKGLRLLRARGYANSAILREGIGGWIGRVLEPRLAVDATEQERAEFLRAEQLSRFFGGMPRSNVARSDLPRGYGSREFTRRAIAGIRRRGC